MTSLQIKHRPCWKPITASVTPATERRRSLFREHQAVQVDGYPFRNQTRPDPSGEGVLHDPPAGIDLCGEHAQFL